jgi:hypothetical protein
MADDVEQNGSVSAPGELIHLPDPSFLPVVTAAGLTIAIVGVVISWVVFGIGIVVSVIAIGKWIAATRRETNALPLEH